MAYKIINIKDICNSIGEDKTREILSGYKCDLNSDVEYFLKEKAIEFSKQDISRTFLVLSTYKGENVIVGYFAIASKATVVKKCVLSNTKKKRFLKYGEYNDEIKGYIVPLPLIGQLGKNYNNGYDKLITGDILLKMACSKVKETQNILGGKYVFLECEDNRALRDFYEANGFECFRNRVLEKSERNSNQPEYLLQMLKDLSKFVIE